MTYDEWRRNAEEGRRLAEEDAAADKAFDRELHDDANYDHLVQNHPLEWMDNA